MAEIGSKQQNAASLLEEELNVLIGDYSMPHIAELSPDSMLTKSQYAKVIFHDIADIYPTDADISCRYSLTDGVSPSHGDRIALYRVGWSSVQDYILFEWAPGPPIDDKSELQVLFKASSLPKDIDEFYQLCYVTSENTVCGASVPFQFRHPYESELCVVEETGDLVVIRSRTALTDEKLRKAVAANDVLRRENSKVEKEMKILEEKYKKTSTELKEAIERLKELEDEKQALEKRLEENSHMERHMERVQKDLLSLDTEKNQSMAKLQKAEQLIAVLTATMDTLTADKEHMAQLLRSETQNKSGVVAEASQYKGQVDSLSHMLEALTQSKELVAQELRVQQAANTQLRQDLVRLERESREQQNKIEELEKQKKKYLEVLDQSVHGQKAVREQNRQMIQNLEKEKEGLLSELVNTVSAKQQEIKVLQETHEKQMGEASVKTRSLEHTANELRLKMDETRKDFLEVTQVNECLKRQLQEAQNVIVENERSLKQLKQEKEALEADLKENTELQLKLKEYNEMLGAREAELESELSTLKSQSREPGAQHKRQMFFRDLFTNIELRIANLEMEQEEVVTGKNVQVERLDAITGRFKELELEERKLRCERADVAAIRDTQEDELAHTSDRLKLFQARMRGNFAVATDFGADNANDPSMDSLKDTVNELTLFVDSSKMRITDIDQRLSEIDEEKIVLNVQQIQALERKHEYVTREDDVRKELAELQDREREIVREQGGQLASMQDLLDYALSNNSEILANGLGLEEQLALEKKEKAALLQKLMDGNGSQDQQCSSLNSAEVKTCLEQEEELKLRLQLAGEAYRKLYTEKQKVEKKLAKLYQKLSEKKVKSSALQAEMPETSGSLTKEQPVTAELISISQASGTSPGNEVAAQSQQKGGPDFCFICPICSVTFPPGAYDLFTQHFDAHIC